jgi:hypothetical protein
MYPSARIIKVCSGVARNHSCRNLQINLLRGGNVRFQPKAPAVGESLGYYPQAVHTYGITSIQVSNGPFTKDVARGQRYRMSRADKITARPTGVQPATSGSMVQNATQGVRRR